MGKIWSIWNVKVQFLHHLTFAQQIRLFSDRLQYKWLQYNWFKLKYDKPSFFACHMTTHTHWMGWGWGWSLSSSTRWSIHFIDIFMWRVLLQWSKCVLMRPFCARWFVQYRLGRANTHTLTNTHPSSTPTCVDVRSVNYSSVVVMPNCIDLVTSIFLIFCATCRS